MRKFWALSFICLFASIELIADEDISGYWKVIDDDQPRSVLAIYQYGGKYYGKIVETFGNDGQFGDTLANPEDRAPALEGHPFYAGLDIIFGVEKVKDKFKGKIMDPKKGDIFDVVLWKEQDNLIVRGEISLLGTSVGQNETWVPAEDSDFAPGFKKPDPSKFVPEVPEAIKKY